ncbi:hypothetical protein A9A72_124581 [Stutzerimonas stutzeri]|jgi:hypothetical protein|uniref:Uncharacterized protein n=1 Tax=Stutzerimonas stutzeri TaxID=316 RepID=A0A5S5B493_STUST|nr:hypothetical protein A9A72_124581 [Stutzerimonas stutzeri]
MDLVRKDQPGADVRPRHVEQRGQTFARPTLQVIHVSSKLTTKAAQTLTSRIAAPEPLLDGTLGACEAHRLDLLTRGPEAPMRIWRSRRNHGSPES